MPFVREDLRYLRRLTRRGNLIVTTIASVAAVEWLLTWVMSLLPEMAAWMDAAIDSLWMGCLMAAILYERVSKPVRRLIDEYDDSCTELEQVRRERDRATRLLSEKQHKAEVLRRASVRMRRRVEDR